MNQHDQIIQVLSRSLGAFGVLLSLTENKTALHIINLRILDLNRAIDHVEEMQKNEHDSDDVLKKAGSVDMTREALRMIDTIIDAAFDGGNYDGSEIQDTAAEHGLLRQEEMKEPCAGYCRCLEAGAEFPTQCYRKTYKQALAAEKMIKDHS